MPISKALFTDIYNRLQDGRMHIEDAYVLIDSEQDIKSNNVEDALKEISVSPFSSLSNERKNGDFGLYKIKKYINKYSQETPEFLRSADACIKGALSTTRFTLPPDTIRQIYNENRFKF